MTNKVKITKRTEDFSKWYLDIVEAAELAENSAVRGCMVIKPYGYALWENYQKVLDKKFKELGHVNAYFPLFIPKSFFDKEAKHVEGFAKESAIVTHHRLKLDKDEGKLFPDPESELEEPLIVRPTSETIIYDSYSKWVSSYRDLPIMINQWANAVRWELKTKPFIRTSEFLWQEGHTEHATQGEADVEARQMLETYRWFTEEFLAISVIPGVKTESEKFPGALKTYTIEARMQDGKALQAGTSHNLGDNFAKAFEIKFQDKDGEIKYAWQTSWGFSTRMIGALIMTHSDDNGLVLPPKIAPTQVVILPFLKQDDEVNKKLIKVCEEMSRELVEAGISIKVDSRDFLSFGEKSFEWEKKGVPVRIEIGQRELESSQLTVVRRDTLTKTQVNKGDVNVEFFKNLFEEIQNALFAKSKQLLADNIISVQNYDEFKNVIKENKFALVFCDGSAETEERVKEETKATARCIPFANNDKEGICIFTGKSTRHKIIFGKAY